jgi:hypothetical protein
MLMLVGSLTKTMASDQSQVKIKYCLLGNKFSFYLQSKFAIYYIFLKENTDTNTTLYMYFHIYCKL